MLEETENEYTNNMDNYPLSVDGELILLVTYKVKENNFVGNTVNESELMAFLTDGEPEGIALTTNEESKEN